MDNIAKSSRHSNITGRFAEALVLYWRSRDGFECAQVDHTGIDILAHNCRTRKHMGISVKSRSRYKGTETGAVSCSKGDYKKIDRACEVFQCDPYYAIVVDTQDHIRMFLTSKEHFIAVAKQGEGKAHWGMTIKHLEGYRDDPEIKTVDLTVLVSRWWDEPRRKV